MFLTVQRLDIIKKINFAKNVMNLASLALILEAINVWFAIKKIIII